MYHHFKYFSHQINFTQDILCKIKTHLIDNKKHIRYGDWTVNNVRVFRNVFYFKNFFSLKLFTRLKF